ncbi:MAG: glycyl-radical enzyme activating protein [Clostridia bacterium]|nr:glycyl-radical enzyme activating protein [Clostridia bacterium]
MKSYITDIQRFSLRDGDGIRTTVFFKGCNMKCPWCHNPETVSASPEIMFYENKCIGCGKCFEACPVKAHKCTDGKHTVDRSLCTNCGRCASVCYAQALTVCGKEMTAEEIMHEIRQDAEYYKNSGGGVTLSGGEVLCNRELALEIANACHNEGISVAIESNISFPYDYAEEIFKASDLIMCDFKIFDDEAHKKYTGVSNKNIMENLRKLDTLGKPIIVRTPLIPNVTDSTENLCAIASFIKDMKNLVRYEILNFNPLGEGKYRGLDKENEFINARPEGGARLDEIKSAVEKIGVTVKII